jgi:ribosomal silencing factor RsfS
MRSRDWIFIGVGTVIVHVLVFLMVALLITGGKKVAERVVESCLADNIVTLTVDSIQYTFECARYGHVTTETR